MEENSLISSSWLQYLKEMKEFFGNSGEVEQRTEHLLMNEEKECTDLKLLNAILLIIF